MSVSYDQFLSEVLPYAPDISEPAALKAIRNACIEFCERTLIWQQDFTLDLVEGQSVYTPPAPLDTRRAAVVSLWVEDLKFMPIGSDALTARDALDWRSQNGLSGYYTEVVDGGIRLAGVPTRSITGALRGVQALAPTRDSDEVGVNMIYERWAKAIANGALAELQGSQGATYFNPQMAQMRGASFNALVAKARAEVSSGNGRGQNRMQMRPFARGRYPWR